jgi:hypothetical protein
VLDEPGGAEAAPKRARRVLVLGADPAEPGLEPEPAGQERAGACILMQRRFVGRAEALVEVKVELTKTEGGRASGGRRSDSPRERRRGAWRVRRGGRRRRYGACAYVSYPHTCRESREYARQRPAEVEFESLPPPWLSSFSAEPRTALSSSSYASRATAMPSLTPRRPVSAPRIQGQRLRVMRRSTTPDAGARPITARAGRARPTQGTRRTMSAPM